MGVSDQRASSESGPSTPSSTASPSSSSSSSRAAAPVPRTPHYPFYPPPCRLSLCRASPAMTLREPPGPDVACAAPRARTLAEFRAAEGAGVRAAKLRALWDALPSLPDVDPRADAESPTRRLRLPGQDTPTALSPERAARLKRLYEEELVRRFRQERPEARLWGGADEEMPKSKGSGTVTWPAFRRFLWDQERELWDIFQELDKNGDGRLDAGEMRAALARSGIDVTQATVNDLVRFLASGAAAVRDAACAASPSAANGSGAAGSLISASPLAGPSSEPAPSDPAFSSPTSDPAPPPPVPAAAAATPELEDKYITFAEFRDFLIMLPRRATPLEIYKFYQVRKRFSDGRGAARVDKEGDLNVSFPKGPGAPKGSTAAALFHKKAAQAGQAAQADAAAKDDDDDFGDTVEEERNDAWRFLLAGGVAGAVSRTVTAPFDRLKVFLITTDASFTSASAPGRHSLLAAPSTAVRNLWTAVARIYADGGGLRAFWVGNGLNVTKIFPESAIKFVSYEQSKRLLGKYWDRVSDPADLSSSSRFIAGGIGGITSQFAIYGLETLKTRIQSETGPKMGMREVARVARGMWASGGIRAYYRGLTLGLVGVFPYSAIDMGTYETLKTAYCRSTGKDEPEVYAVLSFGALSGSIGAASVYPVNLLRTRLQASGSSGHPQAYTGFVDVLQQTLAREGWRGLYKGLLPSILKVGPAVGVSWIVYEDAKRRLGV